MNLPCRHASNLQSGLGLVEIMISLVIGLMLLATLTHLLMSGKRVSKTQDDLLGMQENVRFALNVMGKAIRQSGYRLNISQPLSDKPMEGEDGNGSGFHAAPDTITLRHDPAWVSDKKNALKGEEGNCAGGVITSNNSIDTQTGLSAANTNLVVSTFFIDAGELRCRTTSTKGKSTSAVLSNQIENMQIEYGIDRNGNGQITAYETASHITDFSLVRAVRIHLLMKGSATNVTSGKPQTLTFNGASYTATDGYLRQVYSTTIAIRNFPR